MASPQVASSIVGNNAVNSTSHPLTMPSGVAAGDRLVFGFVNDGATTVSVADGSWTSATIGLANGNTARLSIIHKIADGTETTLDVTTAASQMSAWFGYRITGFDSAQALDVAVAAPATSQNPDPPTNTAPWGAEDNLAIVIAAWDSNPTVTAYPANYTANQVTAVANQSTHGCGIAAATREIASATEDPGTFTLSASISHVAQMIFIRPSAAGTYDGDGDLALSGLGIDADGAFDVPEYEGDADLALPGLQSTVDGFTAEQPTATDKITQTRFGIAGRLYGSFESLPDDYEGTADLGLPGVQAQADGSYAGESTPTDKITQTRFGIFGRLYGTFGAEAADEYDGAADLALPGVQLTADGDFAEPEYAGSADLSLPTVELTADGEFAEQAYIGTADLGLPGVQLESDGTFDVPQYDGDAELGLPGVQLESDGEFVGQGYAGTADLGLPTVELVAEGTFDVPAYEGDAELGLPTLAMDADGAIDNPATEYEGSAELGLPAPSMVAEGAIENPVEPYEGSADLGLPGIGFEFEADVTGEPYFGSSDVDLPGLELVAVGAFSVTDVDAMLNLDISTATIEGLGAFAAPPTHPGGGICTGVINSNTDTGTIGADRCDGNLRADREG